MTDFTRHIGIDYSGAKTPVAPLKGLRIYMAEHNSNPGEVLSEGKYWSRRGCAEWLVEILSEDVPTLVGIDHGFSFPLAYFDNHKLDYSWPKFLEYVQLYCPSDGDQFSIYHIRKVLERAGDRKWRRLTEQRAGGAKSVFHFNVSGQVAPPTHAGIPWLRFIRNRLGDRVHFWPFDGWHIPQGKSAIVEVYPRLWLDEFKDHTNNLTTDQRDAYCVAAWASAADREGRLGGFLEPDLPQSERDQARVEGWILGVTGE